MFPKPILILVLLLCCSRAFGQSSFEAYLSTNGFVQHIAFESRVSGQAATVNQASDQPDTWFHQNVRTNGVLELVGTSGGRLWLLLNGNVLIADIPSPNTPTPKLTQGQLEFASKKQLVGTALSFGFQSAELGTFKWEGDSFQAKPRQTDHQRVEDGTVSGRVTAREGGFITSLFYRSSVLPDVTNYVRYTYNPNVHPWLPTGVSVEFTMEGQRYAYETRYSSIKLGITNTPAGGYVPSLWMTGPAKSVVLATNGNLYSLNQGKPKLLLQNPGGAPTGDAWVSSTGLGWFAVLAAAIVGVAVFMKTRKG